MKLATECSSSTVHAVRIQSDDTPGKVVTAMLTLNGSFSKPIALDVLLGDTVLVHGWRTPMGDLAPSTASNVRLVPFCDMTYVLYDMTVTTHTIEDNGSNMLDMSSIVAWTVKKATFSKTPDMMTMRKGGYCAWRFDPS
jgi:hypothetical protein